MQDGCDRNLLFGILALQNDFIDRDQLVEAINAWVLEKSTPLGAILARRGWLAEDVRALLDALVDKQIAKHQGDVQESIAALSSISTAHSALNQIDDDEVQATLRTLPKNNIEAIGTVPFFEKKADKSGRFTILRPHAAGGLGEVFVARDNEIDREVALKQIQSRYAGSVQQQLRFKLEAEVTGGLEHPGIVPVYSLGHYDDGRPFYTMRFIQGESLKDAIDQFHRRPDSRNQGGDSPGPDFHSLEFRSLLRRLIDVCNAIAYAHGRGVLHRDLKPGNIMVGKYGETLVVDWGLAKTLGKSAGSDTSLGALVPPSASGSGIEVTVAGTALGTPAHMSPEQAEGKLDELGPATDVYSLGTTLYTILTGVAPFQGKALMDVLARVRAGDFVWPHAVQSAVPKALEAICLKAMALRPADRYAAAGDLAADIERWLADEPIAVWREPLTLRARRWLRRRPGTFAAIAATILVGLLGLSGGLYFVNAERLATAKERDAKEQARRDEQIQRERAQANESRAVEQQEEANKQRLAAEKRFGQVQKAVELMTSIFKDLDPKSDEKDGKPLRAILGDRLDRVVANLEGEATGDPSVVARLQFQLGEALLGLSRPEKAVAVLNKSRKTLTQLLGPEHADTLACVNNLAIAYRDAGKPDQALPLLLETLEISKRRLGVDNANTLAQMNNLASVYMDAGKVAQALPLLEEALRIKRTKFGVDNANTLNGMNNLAMTYQLAGKFDLALPLLKETFERRHAKLGPAHQDTLTSRNNLAGCLSMIGEIDKAISLHEGTLRLMNENLGPDHADTLTCMNNLAACYSNVNKHDKALPLLRKSLELRRSHLGPNHPATLVSLNNLAQGCRVAGKLDEAVPLFEEALKRRRDKLGADHVDTIFSVGNLASVYLQVGDMNRARPLFAEFLRGQRRNLGAGSPRLATLLVEVSADLLKNRQPADAEPLLREALAIREQTQPKSWTTFNTKSLLGSALLNQKKYAEAEPILLSGFQSMKDHASEIPIAAKYRLGDAAQRLATLYEATGKPVEAGKWKKELETFKANGFTK